MTGSFPAMAKEYQVTRNVNRLMAWAARRGMGKTQLMPLPGEERPKARVPVSPLVLDGAEYLISPYGEECRGYTTSGPTPRHPAPRIEGRQVRLEEMTGPSAASAAAAYYRERLARPTWTCRRIRLWPTSRRSRRFPCLQGQRLSQIPRRSL